MARRKPKKAELEKLAEDHDIVIERGSGADGAVLVDDLMEALRVAGVETDAPPPEPGEKKLYRVLRAWCGLSPGSVVELEVDRAWQFSSENDERKSSPPHLSPLHT